ncbi:MAG: alpha/beta hydrolase-fold protein [Bdellovibrionales bacterium]
MRFVFAIFIFISSLASASSSITFHLKTGIQKQQVFLASSLMNWRTYSKPFQEVTPGTYSLTIPTPWTPSFSYKFVVDGKWQQDLNNPKSSPDGHGGLNSVYLTSFKESPLLAPPNSSLWIQSTVRLPFQNTTRDITVLAPPFLPTQRIPIIYFNDGGDYLNFAFLQNILTNYYLSTGKAFAAVFISPIEREREYGSVQKNSLDNFISQTAVPYVESHVFAGGSREKRVMIGPSLGGLSSARTGLVTSDFGFVVCQSGAFWYVDPELEMLVTHRTNSPRFFLTYGIFENEKILTGSQKFKTFLDRNNLTNELVATLTAHDWISWRNQMKLILDWFVRSSK